LGIDQFGHSFIGYVLQRQLGREGVACLGNMLSPQRRGIPGRQCSRSSATAAMHVTMLTTCSIEPSEKPTAVAVTGP
jgi:hypothetical protein